MNIAKYLNENHSSNENPRRILECDYGGFSFELWLPLVTGGCAIVCIIDHTAGIYAARAQSVFPWENVEVEYYEGVKENYDVRPLYEYKSLVASFLKEALQGNLPFSDKTGYALLSGGVIVENGTLHV